jgi:hypothetical protein
MRTGTLKSVRKLTIYVLPHSHTDNGGTTDGGEGQSDGNQILKALGAFTSILP